MKDKIKIVYMIDALDTDRAGTENQLVKLINGLNKKQFSVHLICLKPHPWLQKNAHSLECSIEVIEFKLVKVFFSFLKILRSIRRLKPDVVHTFFPTANIFGVVAAKLAGTKAVISSRRDFGLWMNRYNLPATRFANRFVDRIVTNSNKVKKLTEEKENVDGSRIDVILNGINLDFFDDMGPDRSLAKRLNIPDNDKVVGIVANFRPVKRHHTFLKAAAAVLEKMDNVSFLLIGMGDFRSEVEAFAKKLDISDKTRFIDSQKDIRPYLSIMDIGVNCSETEGLSNAIIEYMAAGIPSIVTETGGNVDLITNDYNGYTFKVNDDSALASLVIRLLKDPATSERLAKNAKKTVKENMSLDIILSKYESFYKNLLKA